MWNVSVRAVAVGGGGGGGGGGDGGHAYRVLVAQLARTRPRASRRSTWESNVMGAC